MKNKPKYLRNKRKVTQGKRVVRGRQRKIFEIIRWYIEKIFTEV